MRPARVVAPLTGLEGRWVAIRGDEVLAAKESSDAIFGWLRSHRIPVDSVVVLRVPDEDEPELVGLG
jgi:hypothetical protein